MHKMAYQYIFEGERDDKYISIGTKVYMNFEIEETMKYIYTTSHHLLDKQT